MLRAITPNIDYALTVYTSAPQREFYDLRADPFQLNNNYARLRSSTRMTMLANLRRLRACAGETCRIADSCSGAACTILDNPR
jgi:hypothetical protein